MPEPRVAECGLCFVRRMLEEHGCDDTLRWARSYREQRAPAATGWENRLVTAGAGCDCEVFDRGWRLVRELCERDVHTDELVEPAHAPPCGGARPGSTKPCGNWVRHRRYDAVTWP